jgi:hypothetical protein
VGVAVNVGSGTQGVVPQITGSSWQACACTIVPSEFEQQLVRQMVYKPEGRLAKHVTKVGPAPLFTVLPFESVKIQMLQGAFGELAVAW